MATLGETLQQAREQMRVSLEDAERETHIRRKILAAFEDDNQADLPPIVYARGLLRNYANYLGIDPNTAAEMFDAQGSGGRPRAITKPHVQLASPSGEVRTTLRYPPSILALFTILGLAIFAAIVIFNMMGGAKGANNTAAIATPLPLSPTVLVAVATTTNGVMPFLPTPTSAGGGQSPTPPLAVSNTVVAGVKITPTPAPPNPNVGVGTPVVGVGIAASPTVTKIAATPSLTLSPLAPGQGVQVVLVASSDSWMQVTVDGLQQFNGTMPGGSKRTFSGDNTVFVWVGNAGGVSAIVNGQNRGPLGQQGKVIKRQWDSNGNETNG